MLYHDHEGKRENPPEKSLESIRSYCKQLNGCRCSVVIYVQYSSVSNVTGKGSAFFGIIIQMLCEGTSGIVSGWPVKVEITAISS